MHLVFLTEQKCALVQVCCHFIILGQAADAASTPGKDTDDLEPERKKRKTHNGWFHFIYGF